MASFPAASFLALASMLSVDFPEPPMREWDVTPSRPKKRCAAVQKRRDKNKAARRARAKSRRA